MKTSSKKPSPSSIDFRRLRAVRVIHVADRAVDHLHDVQPVHAIRRRFAAEDVELLHHLSDAAYLRRAVPDLALFFHGLFHVTVTLKNKHCRSENQSENGGGTDEAQHRVLGGLEHAQRTRLHRRQLQRAAEAVHAVLGAREDAARGGRGGGAGVSGGSRRDGKAVACRHFRSVRWRGGRGAGGFMDGGFKQGFYLLFLLFLFGIF